MTSSNIDLDKEISELMSDLEYVNAYSRAKKIFEMLADKGNDAEAKANSYLLENPVNYKCLIEFSWLVAGEYSTAVAKTNAMKRLEKDPVQIALKLIELEFYKVSSEFEKYGYGAEFCRKMGDKYPIIDEPKTIQNLVTRLKKKSTLAS